MYVVVHKADKGVNFRTTKNINKAHFSDRSGNKQFVDAPVLQTSTRNSFPKKEFYSEDNSTFL